MRITRVGVINGSFVLLGQQQYLIWVIVLVAEITNTYQFNYDWFFQNILLAKATHSNVFTTPSTSNLPFFMTLEGVLAVWRLMCFVRVCFHSHNYWYAFAMVLYFLEGF